MLKVAIVGCGKIADSHAEQIQYIGGCELVGVCDREKLMAKQLYERFPVKGYFDNAEELLAKAKPDVVHITTPPQSHFDLARQFLEGGCHVYVEKPFALDTAHAIDLIELAERRGLKITVGNDAQFTHAAMRLRSLVKKGYLGGDPVHMESYYCYELTHGYASALLGDEGHWVRRLPGMLLHNIISHGIVRIAEYLKSDTPAITAFGCTSPMLRQAGEREIKDELRLIVADDETATAYFTFSSQMRPSLHQFRIYGPANGLLLDDDEHTVIKLRGERYKSYAQKFIPPVAMAGQYVGNAFENMKLFLKRDFSMKAGMRHLIEAFYRSITEGELVPVPYREIVLTCRIMETIFNQLDQKAESSVPRPAEAQPASSLAGFGV